MNGKKGLSFSKVVAALSVFVLLFSLAMGASASLFNNFAKRQGVGGPFSVSTSEASDDGWLAGYSYRLAVTSSSALADVSFVNLDYGYYNASLSGIRSYDTILNMQKVAVLNGQRYLFAGKGWCGIETPSNIRVYEANQNWEPTKLLDTSNKTYADFYVTTVPEIWSDTAIIHGNTGTRGSGLAFIGFFNATTNQFFDFQDLPSAKGDYLTQVYYISSRNIFVMTLVAPGNSTTSDTIFTTTLENLKSPSAWTEHVFSNAAYAGCEHMFAYLEADGHGYINRFSAAYGNEIFRIDMDSWKATQIWQNPPRKTSGYLRSYIAATDTGIVFSTSNVTGTPSISNPGTWRYWFYNGTFNNFANVKIQGYSSNTYEGHANIFPTSNGFLLLSNVRDNDSAGYWYLYSSANFSLLETYQPGSSWHNSDNFAVEDGFNLILGGEGRTNVGLVILNAGLSRKVQTNFDDVRFTSYDGMTELAYRLVEKYDGDYATFAVDTSSTSSNTFYIYYGKSEGNERQQSIKDSQV